MKSYKLIGEFVLAIFLIVVGYFLYKFGMNMRHDLPIIKGVVGEDDADVKDKCKGANGKTSVADCLLAGLDKNIYAVATFTESVGLLKTDISYPAGRIDILDIIKADYEKFKSDYSDMLQASTSPNQNPLMYTVNYDELATTTYYNNYLGYKLSYYTFSGGAHGSPGVWSYNYIGNKKVDNAYDAYTEIFSAADRSKIIKDKSQFYKTLHDESKKQVVKSLGELLDRMGKDEKKTEMNWIEEGLSYSATNTVNYDTWWIKDDSLYIYIAPYQVVSYAYGDREVKINIDTLK